MTAHATLTERNRAYADTYSGDRPPIEPTMRTLMLCCADHRVDPAHTLGLEPNEVAVLRNPGGRVTSDVLHSLAVLGTIASLEGFAPGFELILMHHTDCGLSHLSPDTHGELLAPMFGIDRTEVASRHIADPRRAVATDVDLLRANPFVPRTLVVSGLVYDVDTGRVDTIVPPGPLGSASRKAHGNG